jgi:acetyl esterase/lipase
MGFFSGLGLLFCAGSFLLCLWIVLPAPIFSLLPLSVGSPEISPWLVSINFLSAMILTTILLKNQSEWGLQVALSLSVAALILSSLPLVQLQQARSNAGDSMIELMGEEAFANPIIHPSKMRSQPFVLADAFRGIAIMPVRESLDIPFATPGGVTLTLNVYRPMAVGDYPAIVLIYGGAWQRGNPAQDAMFSRYMANQGYVVWAISYRHAPQFQFPAQINDVRSALTFIKQNAVEYETDLNRVAIMGRSAGAQLASLAGYGESPIAFRAVVNYYGPVNLTAGYYDVPNPDPIGSRSVLTTFLGGTPDEKGAEYYAASPLNAVRRDLPPSLLIYGGRDHIVMSKFGKRLALALAAKQNQAVFIEIPWADHAFDSVFNGVSNQFALYYTERFLAWAFRTLAPSPPGRGLG